MKRSVAFILAAACAACGVFAADQTDPAAEAFTAQALEQARAIAPSGKKPETRAAIQELRGEISVRQQAWTRQLKFDPAAAGLLRGISEDVLAQARKIAPDKTAAAQALKGANLPLFLALAAGRNPEVLASLQNWRASVRRFEQAGFLEDLLLQFNSFTRDLDTRIGPQTHRPMPGVYPSTLALKGEVIDLEAGIAWLNHLQTLRKTLNEAAKSYFDVQHTLHALAIAKESRAVFAQMAESTRAQLEAGNASQADVLKARSELASQETRIAVLERERVNGLAKLNFMLALPSGTEWGVWTETDLSGADIPAEGAIKAAASGAQEVLAARKEAELMTAMVRMAEVEITPRAGPGYSQFAPTQGAVAGPTRSMMAAFPERQEASGGDAAMFTANAAYVQELRVRVQQSKDMLELAQSKAEFAAKDAAFRLDRAQREQKTLADVVVPDSKQTLAALRERYSHNAASLSEYLEASRSFLESALMFQSARRERNQALVDLRDAMGQSAANLLAGSKD